MPDQSIVVIGPQGRLVVPSALRRQLGFQPGQALVASAEDGRLVLEPREAVIRRLRARFAAVPSEVSLVDELLAERRQEALREDG